MSGPHLQHDESKKLESSLEGGAESSLAALRKNVSNGIEMIL